MLVLDAGPSEAAAPGPAPPSLPASAVAVGAVIIAVGAASLASSRKG